MSKPKKGIPYPVEICADCGDKYGNRECGMATWSMGTCDICGRKAPTTEPRDFGHLKDGWQKEKRI